MRSDDGATAFRLSAWLAVTAGAALVAPAVRPLDATLNRPSAALPFGCLVGGFAFVLLVRRRIAPAWFARLPRRRLAARVVVLGAKSAQEEAIWRALVLGLLLPIGCAAALTVSTVLFAAAHLGRLGRRAWAHLVTGSLFGLAYLATGRLGAAIAAHGTYNVLVGVGAMAVSDRSVFDTGRNAPPLVASETPSADLRPMRDQTALHSPPMALLEGVTKSFASVKALDAVDLDLRRGEIVALLGPNGAGKSTAVSIMLGLRRPDVGRARLLGRDPRDPAARQTVGAVLQEVGFPPGLRVRETVELVRAHFPHAPSATEILDRLELSSAAERHAGGLSGGQRRRLAVALALAGQPEVLFLDEPTAAMDAGARRALLGDLAEFALQGGAVLLTTQQLAEAEEIATRVVLLTAGRTVLEGTVAEVRARGGFARVAFRATARPPLDGVSSVDSRGERHVVYVDDADAFVAALVRSGVKFSELEVVPASLEDAFVSLTGVTR